MTPNRVLFGLRKSYSRRLSIAERSLTYHKGALRHDDAKKIDIE